MGGKDLYAILEISPDASRSEVRQAYFRLAKVYHPDRQAGDDPASTEHFLAVQEAYEVLRDPGKREDYDRRRVSQVVSAPAPGSVDSGAQEEVYSGQQHGISRPSLTAERDASMGFMKAEALTEAGAEGAALRVMKAVVKAVPDKPDYLSLLGYLMAVRGERLHAARDYCRRAVEAEPYNADFLAHLGYVYQAAGLKQTAEQYFEQALEWNPQQPVARVYSKESGRGGEKGLLSGLWRALGLQRR